MTRVRVDSVADRYTQIRIRIEAACGRSDRDPSSVTLVGASKVQPVARLQAAWDAGLHIFGENRVQEARDKQPHLPAAAEWHMLGPLQSNKARLAVSLFNVFHAVDRLKIARILDREARRLERTVAAFLEINLGGETTKHGFTPADLPDLVKPLSELEHLRIVGLMAIPPQEKDDQRARSWFRGLRELRDDLGQRFPEGSFPGWLSMGMSHDFEAAIEEGAYAREGRHRSIRSPPLAWLDREEKRCAPGGRKHRSRDSAAASTGRPAGGW